MQQDKQDSVVYYVTTVRGPSVTVLSYFSVKP